MSSGFLITLGATFISFLIAVVYYSLIERFQDYINPTVLFNNTFAPLGIVTFISALGAYFFLYTPDDFIGSLKLWQILVPFIGAFIINGADSNNLIRKNLPLILILTVAASVAVMPQTSFAFLPQFSPLINALIIGGAWLLFSVIFQYAESGEGMLGSQALTISLGIGILGSIDALPFTIGVLGWCFAAAFGALLIFSWPPKRITISKYNAVAFGFLIFTLMSLTFGEGTISCCLIFSELFLVDFFVALLLKMTFIPTYKNLRNNMSYQQAVTHGVPPEFASQLGFKIQFLMLFIGIINVYSPTPWSFLLISTLMALWLNYRLRNTREQISDITPEDSNTTKDNEL